MKNILKDILVVSLEQAVAAPLCSSRLADAGARVIKVERKEGDFARYYDDYVKEQSAYFIWLNRGKESIVADIKNIEDIKLIKNIIVKADIYIQNLFPGTLKKLGLGSQDMRKLNPKLITCDISGYGDDGPYSDMKAYDLLVQAETGLCSITGTEKEPGRVGVSVCDIACGLNAYSGILEALYERKITGKGKSIKVSLFDGMSDWMNVPYLQYSYGKVKPKRVGLSHPSIAPYGAFITKDNKKILISIQNEREWEVLCCKVLKNNKLTKDNRFNSPSKRVINRKKLDGIISSFFLNYSRTIIMKNLVKHKIACGGLNDIEDLAKHPQLDLSSCMTENGEVKFISPPVKGGMKKKYKKVPSLGENSAEIRNEFGEIL